MFLLDFVSNDLYQKLKLLGSRLADNPSKTHTH